MPHLPQPAKSALRKGCRGEGRQSPPRMPVLSGFGARRPRGRREHFQVDRPLDDMGVRDDIAGWIHDHTGPARLAARDLVRNSPPVVGGAVPVDDYLYHARDHACLRIHAWICTFISGKARIKASILGVFFRPNGGAAPIWATAQVTRDSADRAQHQFGTASGTQARAFAPFTVTLPNLV